ncbi:uncharacterized protein L3040_005758 [Drepanopeziza brunnea f. sp. 'multigermtubi']|uniref:Uncharacterized protein n=1 Tax=Marssonina brunnea f. sp. multigermtubi (strain MB_m1) TaxID=1072389 RepID=K1X9L0_MARBU|nr:uncharacterized protein MBM_00884 [Drepanopeziza brunnea f. sp. 'multigermtubi' MB_m1]EKD21771.1 hypothetical protein MBM_00884 [Drepanopeziza brunnea f. sp. 'multigermtubi' MB_m1]KAJ5041207.1 hypothetical protein L3040_005758 [Drepanopeziza brunnea f. sp. 'multigermtubi']
MDSMRSLNSSLPGPGHSAKHEDPARLLAAFKAAALSVTNLYKSAAADQGRARSEGYQDALDELLTYLDKENIGLSDGEGWRIRRWATERLDGRTPTVESDDEVSDNHKATDRSSSPVIQRADPSPTTRVPASNPTRTVSPVRTESVPLPASVPASVPINVEPAPAASFVPPQATFTFRSSPQYQQDTDIILSDLDLSDNTRTPDAGANRPLRTRHNARPGSRPTTTIGRAAGQKRKINFGEFFDIGNLGQGRDRDSFGGAGGGGGKRSRPA